MQRLANGDGPGSELGRRGIAGKNCGENHTVSLSEAQAAELLESLVTIRRKAERAERMLRSGSRVVAPPMHDQAFEEALRTLVSDVSETSTRAVADALGLPANRSELTRVGMALRRMGFRRVEHRLADVRYAYVRQRGEPRCGTSQPPNLPAMPHA